MKFKMATEAVNPVVIVICDENEPKIATGTKPNDTEENKVFIDIFNRFV